MSTGGGDVLVLAELTIGTDGVVTGVAAMRDAVDAGEKDIGSSTGKMNRHFGESDRSVSGVLDHLQTRFFSLRNIAGAALGTFTIAGTIFAVKNFTVELIKSLDVTGRIGASFTTIGRSFSEWVGSFQPIRDFFSHWLPDAILRLGALMKTVFSFKGAAAIFDFAAFQGLFNKAVADMQAKRTALQVSDFLGLPKPEEIEKIAELSRMAIDSIGNSFRNGATSARDFASDMATVIGELAKIRNFEDATKTAIGSVIDLDKAFYQGKISIQDAMAAWKKLRDAFLNTNPTQKMIHEFDTFSPHIAAAVDRLKSLFDGLGVSIEGAAEKIRLINEHLIGWTAAFMAVGAGIKTVGASLADLIIQGGKGSELFKEVLKSVAQAMFIMAAEYVAYGIAASTGIGAATLGGSPHQFFLAAAKFAAVGTVAALAARAAGGGSRSTAGGGGSSGSSGGVATATANTRPPQVINVTIEGNVVNRDREVRDLVIDLKRALADGAGGGNLNPART